MRFDGLLTTGQAAAILGLTTVRVWQLARSGLLPPVGRIGTTGCKRSGTLVFLAEDVHRLAGTRARRHTAAKVGGGRLRGKRKKGQALVSQP